MKKILFILIASILVLAACSSGSKEGKESEGNGKKDPNTITAWAWDPKFNIAALKLAEEKYSGDEEINLDIIESGQPDIISKLNTGLSSGTMKGMPNLVLIEDYRAQSFLQAYPDAFYDLSDYINPDDFAKYKIESASLDGKIYGLPFDTGVAGLYVRTDMLEEAGFTVEDFTDITWDEFIDMGKEVKEKTGKQMLTVDPNDLGTIRMMIQTAGEWYLKDDGTTPNLAGNEAMADAFRVYKTMLDEGIAGIHSDFSQLLATIGEEKVVTVAQGNWITPSITAEEEQSGKWAVVPIPRLNVPNAVNASNLGGSSFYVLNIDGKEKAAELLSNTFGSSEDFYQDLVSEIGAIGTYIPAAKGEAYKEKVEFFGGQETVADFSEWMEEIPGVNYGMHTYAIEDILVAEMQNYLNGQDIKEVLDNAQKQAEAQLK
ncbi:lactose/L-arabinose transport system substrate-binding protein [Lederbergia galactosidilyticus]|uniref:ABC transporter substrate-binding protein n=1 Tax=Lederbergia galactosidilytica TaxID=217031 RepID=UPI001AE432CA|nr:extracellular solute-binding protein [Lederbergia galactosidilytica]MBP1916410.1 lactose/L-arabinose transport system substrate-binding protein [Lederbergia galactosidilytica]